jgi:hypothetical protein
VYARCPSGIVDPSGCWFPNESWCGEDGIRADCGNCCCSEACISNKFSGLFARLGFLLKRNDRGVPGDLTLWADWGGSLVVLAPPSLLDVEVKTSGVGFRAMVPVMAQEVADPIRTVPQRAAANLDPKTRRVSCVKVGRSWAGGCVHRCGMRTRQRRQLWGCDL